jgi:hypothetical protein
MATLETELQEKRTLQNWGQSVTFYIVVEEARKKWLEK